MRTFGRFAALATAALTLLSLAYPASGIAREMRSPGTTGDRTTVLHVYSPNQTVKVVVKLPGVSSFNCGPTQVSQLRVEDIHNKNIIPITPLASNLQDIGYFTLLSGRTVSITPAPQFSCLQGAIITFVTLAQCPCNIGPPFNSVCTDPTHPFGGDPSLIFPNGVNLAEATLNVPSPQQETVDISCNQGANATISIQFTPGSGPNWNNGSGINNVTNIQNSWVDIKNKRDNNCNLTGVFAYNLTNCTAGPGACPDQGAFCSTASSLCNIQRLGSGGTVQVTYMGPLAPPN